MVIKNKMAYSLVQNAQFEDHKRMLLVEKLNQSLRETLQKTDVWKGDLQIFQL